MSGPAVCPTPTKRRHRSKRAAVRWWRREDFGDDTRLYPYLCPAGGHWHLTRPDRNYLPHGVDGELHSIALRAADRYSDQLLTSAGWTRDELVQAIHQRLRTKFREMRDAGKLVRGFDGQIRVAP